jgi:purine nucleosidase
MAQRLILDTDIGSDIDDAYALAFILASSEIDLVGVTIASGNTEQRARLAQKMLHVAGRADVPVAVGRATDAGGTVNQAAWAEGFTETACCGQTAAEFLVEQINARPGEICLVTIGPLTNVADTLLIDPDLLTKVSSLVMMAGCVGWPQGATPEIKPEYNVVCDIPAAQAVFAAGVPMVMVPLDATYRVLLEAEQRQSIAERGSPLTDALVGLLALWAHPTPVLHDPLAIGMVLDSTLCGVADLCLMVDDDGFTRPVEGAANCRVAVTPHVGRFLALFIERLAGWTPPLS